MDRRSASGSWSTIPWCTSRFDEATPYAVWAGQNLGRSQNGKMRQKASLMKRAYTWDIAFVPNGRMMANSWRGVFPHERKAPFKCTSPFKSYPRTAAGYTMPEFCGRSSRTARIFVLPNTAGAPYVQ